jgi:hypothetical protein
MAAATVIAGCASIYYPPEGWARGFDTTRYPRGAALDAEIARQEVHFRPDLVDCISKFDPDNIHEMDNGGTYRFTGWFVPAGRFGPSSVRWCMVEKGWQPFPK